MVDPEVDERNLLAARAVVLARIEEKKEVLRIADGGMSAVAVSVFEEAQKKKMEDGEEVKRIISYNINLLFNLHFLLVLH